MTDFIKIPDKVKLYQAKKDARVEVLVGGINEDHFAPSANFSFKMESDKEQFFLNICDDETQMDTADKEEEWNGSDKIKIKDKEESTFQVSENNLKIERVFETTPTQAPRYKLAFSPGVQFFYQPELTVEEIAEGHSRPDNVVGSYAVMCDRTGRFEDKSGNVIVDYGYGHLSHLFAPYWTDTAGKKIKGVQEIIGNALIFPLPDQKWLDAATLPITLDPDINIGTDSIAGTSDFSPANNTLFGFKCASTPTSDGTLKSISAYINATSTRAGKVGVYADDTSYPDALVYGSAEVTIGNGSAGWWTHTATSPPDINDSGQYHVGMWWDTGTLPMKYLSGGVYKGKVKTYASGTSLPNPFDAGATNYPYTYCAYFTYTEESTNLPISFTGEVKFSGSITRKRNFNRGIGGSI